MEIKVIVCLLSHFWLIHFFTYICFINHISRPLSSYMCPITLETARVGSSYLVTCEVQVSAADSQTVPTAANGVSMPLCCRGWVGLWGFLWWAPSAKRKDHHRVSSGWSSVWHRSNTGISSTQYEQIPIILGVWPFWLTPFFFRLITFWRAYG